MILALKKGNLLICFICMLSVEAMAQFKTGVVVDSLNLMGEKDGGCALYLPENYNRLNKYGLVLFFDPTGQTAKPLTYYKTLADELDLIFIGINNSRNGSLSKSFSAFLEAWKWGVSKFSVDLKRVYLAGFSGGARAASYITQRVDFKFAGVIGCGSGFFTEKVPRYPFRFVGTVGDMDMNYYEMLALERRLVEAKWKNDVLIFNGGHVWSPKRILSKALVKIQLSQMIIGELPKDRDFIQANFNKDIKVLEGLKDDWSSYRYLKELRNSYQGLQDLTAINKKFGELESADRIKEILLERKVCEENYNWYIKVFSEEFENIRKARYNDQYGPAGKRWWEKKLKEIERLNPKGKEETDILKKRLSNYLEIAPYERGNRSLNEGDFMLAINYFKVCTWVNQKSYTSEIKLAEAYAGMDDKKNSLRHLKKAVEKGFNQKGVLLKSTYFKTLHGEYGFAKLLSELSIPK